MQIVYTADNDAEAHMMAHMLEREDIQTHIHGAFLRGGVGELPASNLTKIMVPDDDVKRARDIIKQWEEHSPKPKGKKHTTTKPESDIQGRIIAFLFGCLFMWSIMTSLQ